MFGKENVKEIKMKEAPLEDDTTGESVLLINIWRLITVQVKASLV
jgi:hypothetical protein